MRCSADIISIADSKLQEGRCLFQNGFLDSSYYIGGYCVELLLKAKVCKTLGIDNFFDEGFMNSKVKHTQAYKNHDISQLLIFSGIYSQLAAELADPAFKTHWSAVTAWNEKYRYLTGKTSQEVADFLTSVDAISTWIKRHL